MAARQNIVTLMKTIISALLSTLLCVSALAAEESTDLKEKIQTLNRKMATAMIEGKAIESLALYAEDAISMPNYSPMLRGKAAIRKHHEEMDAAGFKFHTFDLTTLIVKEAGEVIHEIGTYSLSLTPPGLDQKVHDKGKYITIWKKQPDGSLQIVLDMWNTDAYPMAQQ